MEAQRRRVSSVGGVEVAHKKAKASNDCGVGSTGIGKNQFPTQQPMTMMPPHYYPPHQYPPGHFPGYPMYPPMMPYPQMYGYHQYPPHMNANMMRQPHNVMPTGFAKPPAPVCAPQATSSTKDARYRVEAKNDVVSARAGETLDRTNSRSITPTVSTETSSASNSPSSTQPVVMKKATETMINSQVSLQGSTSSESEDDTAESNQPFKNSGNVLAVKGHDVLKEKQLTTVNEQDGTRLLKSQKKQDNLPCSSPSEKEEVIQKPQKEVDASIHEDVSTTTYDCTVHEEEEKSEEKVDDIGDSLVLRCDDTNRQVLEGVESLLLLSRVAEKIEPAEEVSNMGSIDNQQSGQGKPLKKRKLQLPMRADRKEGPLPKRMPAAPQRTPAFFQFLLHHKESIEQTIFPDGETSYGLERSEMVAKEGAMWWLASSEDEKQRWADISTHNYLGHRS
mmetsp:Transcript_18671/g.26595  ORF Transcript_18671/g.26595 Transcript_18671/m.26595 type:complete len:448 (-) Transcript_18671:611-1954(-)